MGDNELNRSEDKELDSRLFGQTINRLRRARGLTLATLGQRCGVSKQAINEWQWGQHVPSAPKLLKAARGLNVPVEVLLAMSSQADNRPTLGDPYAQQLVDIMLAQDALDKQLRAALENGSVDDA